MPTANASGIVTGVAFIDANRNGILNAGERRLPGVVLHLVGGANGVVNRATLVTDATGSFEFDNVPAGRYRIRGGGGLLRGRGFFRAFTVHGDQTLTRNVAFNGIRPAALSLRQFLSARNNFPFRRPGAGDVNTVYRENNAPILSTTRDLYGTTSGDSTLFAANDGRQSIIDLAGFFDDPDFTNSRVRFVTFVGSVRRTFDVDLFDDRAPQTVANFFNYVLSNRYDDTIFHRLVSGFVLQGGGFEFNPTTKTITHIVTDPAVQNEFSISPMDNRSNLENTIAMAKVGGDPNSATSEFFFNLANNASNLDNQNQGFTVFGQLVAGARTQIDQLILDAPVPGTPPPAFPEIPLDQGTNLTNFPANTTLGNYARLADIQVIKRDEFLRYRILSVKSLNPAHRDLIRGATIRDNRLFLTTKAGDLTGDVEVTIRAIDRFGASVDHTFTIKVQDLPVVDSVTLSPSTPGSSDTVLATVNAPDLVGTPATFTYVWKVDGVTTKVETTGATGSFDVSTLGSNNAGKVITVEVTPHLRNISGEAVASNSVTVGTPTGAPTFNSANNPSVEENITAVTTVTATDPENDPVTFSIVGGLDAAKFDLDGNTGALSFKTAPNFEMPDSAGNTNTYQVVVQASDGTNTTNQTITVTVTNAPVTFTSASTFIISENTTTVATVMADSSEAGSPTYSITGGTDAALFNIDATTGALTFKTAPNFEAPADGDGNNVYAVQVTANDGEGGTVNQTINVTVTNATVTFTSPNSANVLENTTEVLTVVADSSEAGSPTYSITGGLDKDLFNIDANTGALSFKTAPDFEAPADTGGDNNYEVEVTANDNQGDTEAQTITVTVLDDPGD